jgi:hypothetical protein
MIRTCIDIARRPDYLLIACQPKSASTHLTNVLSDMPDCRSVRLVPGYGRREQELCAARLRRYRFRTTRHLIAQAHVRRSTSTDALITRHDIKVVVLVRDPLDTVVSMRDHIRTEGPTLPFAYLPDTARDWPDDRLDLAIARLIMPWVLNFRLSWANHPDALKIEYEDFVANPDPVLMRIAQHAGIVMPAEGFDGLVSKNRTPQSLFNVGRSGRGQGVSQQVKRVVANLAAVYTGTNEAEQIELDAFARAG